MTPHETYRELLGLSAAGLLDAAGERAVREHVRECPECAARLEAFAGLSRALGALPAPEPPGDLLFRTQARVAAGLAADADRRQGAILAAAGALLAWSFVLGAWYLYRTLVGAGAVWFVAVMILPACIAAPAAAALLGPRRRLERSW